MTWPYLKSILFSYKKYPGELKMLDTDEWFSGERRDVRQVFFHDFEGDTTAVCSENAINGRQSACLSKDVQFTPAFVVPVEKGATAQWLRLSATARLFEKEDKTWAMTQFVVRFSANGQQIKYRSVRVQRLFGENSTGPFFFDVKIPEVPFDKCETYFWNAGGAKPVFFDDLRAETFH